jgi:molecular chaperone DnaJ/curved DNA-binding protein
VPAVDAFEDYYALLGVAPDADDEAIRRAWRSLALEWHPDRAGAQTTMMFQRLSVAYAVLSDTDARVRYDRQRGIARLRAGASAHTSSASASSTSGAAQSGPEEPPIGKRAPGVLLRRLSGPLNILVARGVAREDGDMIELMLDREEATDGGMVTISMRVLVHCDRCGGAACVACGGAGVVEDLYSAWLAVRPGVADGTVLSPSARLPNMVKAVAFRVRLPE